ncbi:hypothetical protein DFH08DRAFT_800606 [Mycena albidolilacea]|uniref:Uncharacterized protein n=1 Tax=Mycena albidolilacea TaxID=1033008 RepID=A0AAD7AK74_9AGAR|nr:hypothetical protein DFH08DRAFT_800606 [Mycena albidolilacea]
MHLPAETTGNRREDITGPRRLGGHWRKSAASVMDTSNSVRQWPPITTGGQRRPPANLLPPGILLSALLALFDYSIESSTDRYSLASAPTFLRAVDLGEDSDTTERESIIYAHAMDYSRLIAEDSSMSHFRFPSFLI